MGRGQSIKETKRPFLVRLYKSEDCKVKTKIDDRILKALGDAGESLGEWSLAYRLWPWNDSNRSKHGAWIRVLVQALWRMEKRGSVGHFWVSHGEGVAGDRVWFRSSED